MPNRAFLVALFFALALFVRPAHAYIDFGSGSYFIQFLLAMVLGSLVYVKSLWRRFLLLFRQNKPK